MFCFWFAVTAIKFANDDKYCLACSSTDGTLSVCALVPSPPSVTCTLRGHTAAVTGKAANVQYPGNIWIKAIKPKSGACQLTSSKDIKIDVHMAQQLF